MSQLKAIQKHREIAIFTSLGEDVLLLHNFNYHEKLGELFSLQVEMLSERNGIVFEELLGQNVTARINLPEHETRYINGFITHFSQGEPKRGFATYHATISPWLWLLTRTSDCHIFQNLTVPDIIQEIFAKHGFAVFELRLTADYREWEYCVQYRETDFNFISRLMEQEGIYYFFEHESDNHTLILADAPSAHEPIPLYEEIPYYPPDSTVVRDHEYIGSWGVNKQVQPGTIALNDFNFKKPRADISTIKQKDQGHQASLLELFDYPGEYTESVESEFYSTVRLEELHVQYETIHATSSARGLTAGGLFCLFKHHRADQNKEYLVTSVSHTVQQDLFSSSLEQVAPFIHTNHFEVITSETPYRTQSNTPKPSIQGVQTAIVVGPPGEEIYTDEFGRVKCQFHWDRYGEMNQDSSCWIRVSQMWAGKEWGHIALPRIGQEVIVDFIEGDPDRPIITGRTYNADNMPPYPLDAMKTRMSIKSSTYKGDGFNELRFEDMAGEEEVFIHAQKNQNNIVRDSETTQIGNNRSETVANNESVMVVNGDRHITVKTGDEVKTIEQGNLTEGIAQTRSTLANVVNVKAQAALKGSAPGIISQTADDLIHLKVGSSEIIITKDLIEIKQGGSAIKLDANVIDQKAGNIHLNKDGGASNGSSESADAELTETPTEELPPEEAPAVEEPWLKEGLVNTEEVKVAYIDADAHVNDEGTLGKFDAKIDAGVISLDHSGHFGESDFGGSHKLKVLSAEASASGGVVDGAGIRGKASAVYKEQGASVFYGDENNPLAEAGAGYKVGSAEAQGEALLGNDGHYRGVGLGGKVGAAAASGEVAGEINIPIPWTDQTFRAAGKLGGEVGALGVGAGAYAKENIKTGRKHLGVSGKVAALLGIKGDVDLSVGPEYTDKKRDFK